MYKFTYFDCQIKAMFSERKELWDTDLEQEISPALERLKQTGEVKVSQYLQNY